MNDLPEVEPPNIRSKNKKSLTRFKIRYMILTVRKILPLVLMLLLPSVILSDPLEPFGYVKQVTQNDGDTVATSQVVVSSSVPTLILPNVVGNLVSLNKTNRKRVIENCGSFVVWIGSNSFTGAGSTSTLATNGYLLSTSTGTNATYTTYSTAAFYGTSGSAGNTGNVCTITESNSQQ